MTFFKSLALAFALGAVAGSMTSGPAHADQVVKSDALSRALENLRASDAEWRREDATYRRQRDGGRLSANDAGEYAEFIASLKRQKLEDCEIVRGIGGNEALKGYDCVMTRRNAGAPSALPPPTETAKTEAEKLEGLEAELKRLEAELDEELRQKQQALRDRRQTQSGGGGAPGSGQDAGQSGGAGGGETGKAGSGANGPKWSAPPEENTAGKTGGSPATGTQTGKLPAGGGQPPAGAAAGPGGKAGPGAGQSKDKEANPTVTAKDAGEDGNDDDIVMRQIREAAERETDPVMKEKLWAEYRKLKAAKR